MNFAYVTSVKSRVALPCMRDDFYRLIGSPRVAELVKRYRAGDTKAKSELPAFLFHATFVDNKRGDQWAVPSGLYMMDFDHLRHSGHTGHTGHSGPTPALPHREGENELLSEDDGWSVAKVWEQMLANIEAKGESIESLGILLVHVTPSGDGLRVVAMMKAGHEELTSIGEWQQWLYEKLTDNSTIPMDTCVKDFARLSFVVPHSEFLYLDDGIFERTPGTLPTPLIGGRLEVTAEGSRTLPTSGTLPTPLIGGSLEVTTEGSRTLPAPLIGGRLEVTTEGSNLEPESTSSEHTQNLPPYEGGKGGVHEGHEGHEVHEVHGVHSFRYNNFLLSEIAQTWLIVHGKPKVGERHTSYYVMAKYFRLICDNNAEVLFAQLPDLGLGNDERREVCKHVVKMKNTSRIPYEFFTFLVENGFRERTDRQKRTGDDGKEFEGFEKFDGFERFEEFEGSERVEGTEKGLKDVALNLPKLPPLIREFVEVAPKDFKVPMIFALFPVLATLCTRLRAFYLDGDEHSPSATTVIYAPQSSGKSFVRRLDRVLLTRLRERDEQSKIKDRLYKEELQVKKNAKELPKNPHAPYRILPAVISVPQLLERQSDAQGLHQFTLLEELDTLTKSNKGGSWADKSDLYRVAYDNGEYGQDYKNTGTFSGTVRLYYNLLMCGTPKQVHRFFNDAENGLVSRVCFCEIKNQLFADLPIWKPFTAKQLEVIERIVKRLDEMTYMEGDVIRGVTSVDMQWIYEPLHEWLKEKLNESTESLSGGMAHFRKRAAVNAFRYAMVCTQMYTQLREPQRQLITDFALWFAEQDLRNRLELFEQEMSFDDEVVDQQRLPQHQLFSRLKDKFTPDEVRLEAMRLGLKTPPRVIISIWKKAELIMKQEGVFVKVKK